MLQMSEVHKVYENTGSEALNGVDITINDGEFVFLVGPSGSGKTTIIKLLTGELRATSGAINVNGFDLRAIKRRQLPKYRRTLGVVFQDFRLIDKMTVYENVAFAMRVVGARKKEINERVPYVLNLVGLEEKGNRYPSELSGGEQQRVSIARALVRNPAVILADEPTGALDSHTGREVLGMLQQMHDEGHTVVLITHDNSIAVQADRIIRLEDGRVVYDGDSHAPEAIVQPTLLPDLPDEEEKA